MKQKNIENKTETDIDYITKLFLAFWLGTMGSFALGALLMRLYIQYFGL